MNTTPLPDVAAPLIVMYHYVWPERPPEPAGVRPLLAEEFERQLDFIQSQYTLLHPAEFIERVRAVEHDRPHPPRRPPCLLTFDDGTADHATVVTPILARRGLSGVFFVLSGPATEGLMPLTHAVHWALSVGDEAVWAALSDQARRHHVFLGNEVDAAKMYHYEPLLRARIKYAANVALPPAIVETALSELARARGTTLADLARGWFVSESQIASMHEAGMVIGLHGHTHRSLQQMGPEVVSEIARCDEMVRRCTGAPGAWWACPFGGTGAAPELLQTMRQALRSAGITAAVGTESRRLRPNEDPLQLPRVDCVKLPPRGTGVA